MLRFSLTPSLLQALDLERGGVVAVAGAGGKSTLVRRLVAESREAGLTTLVSATTRLALTAAEGLTVIEDGPRAAATLDAVLRRDGAAGIAGAREGPQRWAGLPPTRVSALAARAALTLIESDGARGRLLKLPASHEPSVPAATTLLLVVTTPDVLGRPLGQTHVHRLELATASLTRAGLDPTAALDLRALGTLLLDERGYRARLPSGARAAVFLNLRLAALDDAALAELVAQLLTGYDSVACGSTLGGALRVGRRAPLLSSAQP